MQFVKIYTNDTLVPQKRDDKEIIYNWYWMVFNYEFWNT